MQSIHCRTMINPTIRTKTELNSVVKKTWEFYSAIKQPSADALANAGNYKFGQEAGYLYNQFMKIYVVREEVVPGDPTRRTVIRKPTIYNAVRSIEKQLNKELKSNKMTREQVAAEFTNVLKVAISAYDSESESLKTLYRQIAKMQPTFSPYFKM